jgi:polygalacturonase
MSSSSWTNWQNELFEEALNTYDQDTPDCWQTVVTVGGGKTVEDVKRYYQETPLVIVGKCFSLNIY